MSKIVLKTLGQLAGLAAVATGIALTFNAARSKGLTLTRNYFDTGGSAIRTTGGRLGDRPDAAGGHDPSEASDPALLAVDRRAAEPGAADDVAQDVSAEQPSDDGVYQVGDHGFYELTLTQAVRLFEDPATQTQGYLFIDARDDDAFDSGHIPGALQIDHYYLEQYLPDVLPAAFSAQMVIVYCNGDKCEDSILVCNDLLDEGVEGDNLLLFKGGWKEWTANDMPVETGSGL